MLIRGKKLKDSMFSNDIVKKITFKNPKDVRTIVYEKVLKLNLAEN